MKRPKGSKIEDGDILVFEEDKKGKTTETIQTVFTNYTKDEIKDFVKERKEEIMKNNIGKTMKVLEEGDLFFNLKFGELTYKLEVFSE